MELGTEMLDLVEHCVPGFDGPFCFGQAKHLPTTSCVGGVPPTETKGVVDWVRSCLQYIDDDFTQGHPAGMYVRPEADQAIFVLGGLRDGRCRTH